MSRIVTGVAFAILLIALLASGFELSRARVAGYDETPYLLSLPDLSSPRATLQTLLDNSEISIRHYLADGIKWAAEAADWRMMGTLDLTQVSNGARDLVAADASARLASILNRITLPPTAEIPDAVMVKAQSLTEWRVPGTPIVIAKVASGPRTGEFLFSPATVARVGELYDALDGVPQTRGAPRNIYEEWRYTPGPLLPQNAIAALPAPLRTTMFGQAVWQWLGLLVLLSATAIAMVQITLWGVRHDAETTGVFRRFGQPVAALTIIVLSNFALALTEYGLKVWGHTLEVLLFVLQLTAMGGMAWLAVALIQRTGALIIASRGMRDSSIDAQLIRVVTTLLGVGVAVVAGFFAADFVGIPVGPLLAGLGIGGLAIALAVRPTLENVIGGLTLFADRPARVGESCVFGNETGRVEEIGLRTTKIRRLDDTVVTIPNAELAQIRIENRSRRRKYLFNPHLPLRFETTARQLQEIGTGIKEALEQHPKVLDGTTDVRLGPFAAHSLILDVFAYVDEVTYRGFAEVQEELNLAILDIVRRAGTQFALPAQTNYLARDKPPVEPAAAQPEEPDAATEPDAVGAEAPAIGGRVLSPAEPPTGGP